MMQMLQQFIIAMLATLGFTIIFRVPVRHIPPCVIIGACSWIACEMAEQYMDSPVLGCFFGACLAGILSTICAILLKDAATIFIIPGILCLVPGNNIFLTMRALLDSNVEAAVEIGLRTLMMAGAIALGLLITGALMRVVRSLIKRTIGLGDLIKSLKK